MSRKVNKSVFDFYQFHFSVAFSWDTFCYAFSFALLFIEEFLRACVTDILIVKYRRVATSVMQSFLPCQYTFL